MWLFNKLSETWCFKYLMSKFSEVVVKVARKHHLINLMTGDNKDECKVFVQ